jgi:VWFA-related protein
MSRAIYLAIAIAGAMLASSFGQQSSPGSATITSTTELVQVPVVVTRSGRFVPGLRKSDFQLLDDGSEQKIAVFEEVASQDIRTQPRRKSAAGVYTNVVTAAERPQRVTVILIDLINSPTAKQAQAREGLAKFLTSVADTGEPIAVVAMKQSGLEIIHSFATDPEVLRTAVLRMKTQISETQFHDKSHEAELQRKLQGINTMDSGFGPGDPGQELSGIDSVVLGLANGFFRDSESTRTVLTLELIEQVAHYLEGIPGRKSLIWATGGLEFLSDEAVGYRWGPGSPSRSASYESGTVNDRFERAWERLSGANVAVYPLDLTEVENPMFQDAYGSQPDPAKESVSALAATGAGIRHSQVMNGFADRTGGYLCGLGADLDNCFRLAIEDSSRYYLLSYYPNSRGKRGIHKLQVKVAAAGVKIRTRSVYIAGGGEDPVTRQNELTLATKSPLEFTAIPMAVQWMEPEKATARRRFRLTIAPDSFALDGPTQNHFRLTVLASAGNDKGEFAAPFAKIVEANLKPESLAQVRSEGITYNDAIELPASARSVRFVVRDEISGRIGTVTAGLPSAK